MKGFALPGGPSLESSIELKSRYSAGKNTRRGPEGLATSMVIKKRSRPVKAVVVCAQC